MVMDLKSLWSLESLKVKKGQKAKRPIHIFWPFGTTYLAQGSLTAIVHHKMVR